MRSLVMENCPGRATSPRTENFTSPYFYLQQDDVVYVTPNKYKAQAGEINQNRTFYLSIVSTVVSVATLIVTITKIK